MPPRKCRFDRIGLVYDGTAEDQGGRHPTHPAGSGRIYGGEIPEDAVSHPALRRRLRRLRVSSHPFRDQVVGIPVLPDARVGHTAENTAAWRHPISDNHGLPDAEHHDGRAVAPKERIDCGGPPQSIRLETTGR
jgi:hypothetical protein